MGSLQTYWEIQGKKGKKTGYSKRKSQVQTVKDKMCDVSEEHVEAINGKIDKINEALTSGISGLAILEDFKESISDNKEKSGYNDAQLALYNANLSWEISDCDRKIGDLEDEIARLETRYSNELAAEQEAARKALEAAGNGIKKAGEAVGGGIATVAKKIAGK